MNKLEPTWWFVFHNDQVLLEKKEGSFTIPCTPEAPIALNGHTVHNLATLNGYACKTVTTDNSVEENEKFIMVDLRGSYDYIPPSQFNMAGKAREILYWDRTSTYCPVCGVQTQQFMPIAKKCPECGYEMFPNISAAILALVRKEDSILLVRARNFRGPFYGLVAGFLETGETLEECVKREVMEETGLTVDNITYFGNQPWPFPSGLMVGFIADYVSGEINLQDEELSEAAFYTRDNLPELPRKLSLARKMIDWWVNETTKI
ncbi:NAD(+) diphosphatase [Bacteroides sp. 51]|uniref:NAD(+) diphosphatase n=1 Tax=Bacteroides sp. 51 TaxID=2302938 RepID=UPI0013D031CD|nr:NAD(+) diphosphatase [Bacteroides sp. 51]NDV81874.1 NAD(+) diphosphatase [Bacteroides sp. 51]